MRSNNSIKNRCINLGASVTLDFDHSYDVSIAGTSITISTSVWEADNNVVSLSGAATSGDTTTTKCLASNQGIATIQNKVTLSNGDILVKHYSIQVKDPMNTSTTDYP